MRKWIGTFAGMAYFEDDSLAPDEWRLERPPVVSQFPKHGEPPMIETVLNGLIVRRTMTRAEVERDYGIKITD